MSKNPSTELSKPQQAQPGQIAVYEGNPYAILRQDISALPAILSANVGAEGINEFDMDRVGVPSGGGLAWSVPDLNGEPEAVPEIVGVILFHGDRRAYWSVSYDDSGGGSPPDCSSIDGRSGIGYIRGETKTETSSPTVRNCKTCPMSQWGSETQKPGKPPSNGQACCQRKVAFLLRENDVLPLIVDLAPTSIKTFNQFMLRLTSRGIPCYGAVVGLKLRMEQSSGGIKYSVVSPRLLASLSEADRTKMGGIASAMKPYFEKVGIQTTTIVDESPK